MRLLSGMLGDNCSANVNFERFRVSNLDCPKGETGMTGSDVGGSVGLSPAPQYESTVNINIYTVTPGVSLR